MSTIWAFHPIKNKHSLCRWVDCMKKACSSLRVHATNLINFERKKMLPLTKNDLKLRQYTTICGKASLKKFAKDKNYRKVRDYCHFTGNYRGAIHSKFNLRFQSKELPLEFHNGSNYDYHYIIEEFKNLKNYETSMRDNLNVLEKTEKYKTFSIQS